MERESLQQIAYLLDGDIRNLQEETASLTGAYLDKRQSGTLAIHAEHVLRKAVQQYERLRQLEKLRARVLAVLATPTPSTPDGSEEDG